MVTLCLITVAVPVEFGEIVLIVIPGTAFLQCIGIVVGCQNDYRIICDPRLFQLCHQVFQRIFQLQLRCQIAFNGVGALQVLHRLIVLFAHSIAHTVIQGMPAHRHVVNAEGLLVDILRDGVLHHLQVALRPLILHAFFHAVTYAGKGCVAQAHMGQMPVIICVAVIMVGRSMIAKLHQLIANGQELVLLDGFFYAGSTIGRHQTGQIGKFTGAGTAAPKWLIVLRKLDAFRSQAVQRRCQLRIDHFRGESLCCNKNQVFARKQTRIGILAGRGQRCHVVVNCGNSRTFFRCGKLSEIKVHHIFFIDHRLFHCFCRF